MLQKINLYGVAQFYLMMTTKTLQGECSIKAFGIESYHQRSNQLSWWLWPSLIKSAPMLCAHLTINVSRLRLKLKLCDKQSRILWREPMKSTEESTPLERRVAWAKEHWIIFFSEMPLRETNLQSVTQTLHIKAPLHKEHMNLNADPQSQKGS